MKKVLKRKKRTDKINVFKKLDLRQLLLIVFITTVMATVVTLSKYRSSLGKENNIQKVAKPVVNVTTIEDIDLSSMKPGDERIYNFSVNNYSDIDGETLTNTELKYTLEVQTGNYLPITIELYEVISGIVQNTNVLNQTTVTEPKILGITRTSHDYQMKVKWNIKDNDYRYSSEIDYIKVILSSEQIDPREV